jgi:hypothetical protein
VHGTIETVLRVEWRPLAALGSIAAEWRALAARALEPNVFYEPAFALAAAPVFGRDIGAGLVWTRTVPPRLIGFFPARVERRRYGVPLPVLVGWTHPYAPFGAPLVDRELGETALAAWFDHLANNSGLPDIMLLPYVPMDGPFAQALDVVVARRSGQSRCFAQHRRALLAPAVDREDRKDYLDRAMGRAWGQRSRIFSRWKRRVGRAAPAPPPAAMPTSPIS